MKNLCKFNDVNEMKSKYMQENFEDQKKMKTTICKSTFVFKLLRLNKLNYRIIDMSICENKIRDNLLFLNLFDMFKSIYC